MRLLSQIGFTLTTPSREPMNAGRTTQRRSLSSRCNELPGRTELRRRPSLSFAKRWNTRIISNFT
jgi:hypothetical protein